MSSDRRAAGATTPSVPGMDKLLEQYGCGPVRFTGTGDALYERHLMFDNVVDPAVVGPRERYEAVARSVRDVLSQRWVRTENTYERENPKRVYYLSMEFLIGRSLANNIMNLLLDPVVKQAAKNKGLDWIGLLEEEPDAGLGNGGLGRLAACFVDSMATRRSRPWATGCGTSTASSSKPSRTAGSTNSRTTGCGAPIRGRSPGRRRRWRSSSAARSRCAAARWA